MEIKEFMPKLDLRQFLVFVIPGMIFSFTVLYIIDKLSYYKYKLLPIDADFTSVNLPYVSLLIFYLLTSGLTFGIIFHLLYLWHFQKCFRTSEEKISDKDKKPYDVTKYPAEFTEILLKGANIDVSYKSVYRSFFGGLSVSFLLSFLISLVLLLFTSDLFVIILITSYFLLSISSGLAAERLRKEMDDTNQKLVGGLSEFLNLIKKNYPEEVSKNLLKK
ncbi:MAG: hypothetical protein N2V78_12765 [Methanophagales archaeon]|nr:hypothetical protein [Methanophagales archaeon]